MKPITIETGHNHKLKEIGDFVSRELRKPAKGFYSFNPSLPKYHVTDPDYSPGMGNAPFYYTISSPEFESLEFHGEFDTSNLLARLFQIQPHDVSKKTFGKTLDTLDGVLGARGKPNVEDLVAVFQRIESDFYRAVKEEKPELVLNAMDRYQAFMTELYDWGEEKSSGRGIPAVKSVLNGIVSGSGYMSITPIETFEFQDPTLNRAVLDSLVVNYKELASDIGKERIAFFFQQLESYLNRTKQSRLSTNGTRIYSHDDNAFYHQENKLFVPGLSLRTN